MPHYNISIFDKDDTIDLMQTIQDVIEKLTSMAYEEGKEKGYIEGYQKGLEDNK